MRPTLHQDLCMFSSCLLLPGLCKAGRAPFLWEVQPDLHQDLCLSSLCLLPPGLKRVALFFVAGCDLPCARRVALFFLVGS